MKILDESGKAIGKRSPLQFLAQRLYGSEPATKYFESLNARPELKDALMSGVNSPLNFKSKDVTFVNPFYGKVEEGVKHFKDAGLSDEDALKYASADAIKMGYSDAGTTGRLLLENIKAHPFKSAGGALLGGANLAGLFDDDQIIGQGIGLGLGGLTAAKILPAIGVGGIANGALAIGAGGMLGSLFDKLMANKKAQQQYQEQYY